MKPKNFKAREQKIINVAIALIRQQSIDNFTIDKLVARVPFSKGTVYKHFINKEDLLMAISNQATTIFVDLLYRVCRFEGCTRERMCILNLTYVIFAVIHPKLFNIVLYSKSPCISKKSSFIRLKEQENLEIKMLNAAKGIVEEAVVKYNLVLPSFIDAYQVSFANNSMCYGVISLLSSENNGYEDYTSLVIEQELFNQNNLLLDGLNWLPLSRYKSYRSAIKKALIKIFPKEIEMMKMLGRELNF